ncbi:hypothetical protein WG904_03855 [Pedobacter sp. Du54]|uniref:hypothetical protein n=1 Tax=Pedobacter anseongensis TaxID=3133439 RepID=UPI0030957B17
MKILNKLLLLAVLLMANSTSLFADSQTTNTVIGNGIGMGSALAYLLPSHSP